MGAVMLGAAIGLISDHGSITLSRSASEGVRGSVQNAQRWPSGQRVKLWSALSHTGQNVNHWSARSSCDHQVKWGTLIRQHFHPNRLQFIIMKSLDNCEVWEFTYLPPLSLQLWALFYVSFLFIFVELSFEVPLLKNYTINLDQFKTQSFSLASIDFSIYFYRPPSEGWRKVIFSVCPHYGGGGGYPVSDFGGRGYGLRFWGGLGLQSQIFRGGCPGLRFSGGVLVSDFRGDPSLRFSGGYPVSDFQGGSQSQIFGGGSWSQIFGGSPSLRFFGGVPVSDFGGVPSLRFGGGYPVSVQGKIFDTRFGLIHVQTGEKFFVEGTFPPPVKGKNFDTRFGLIHVQTGEKFFVKGTFTPPSKGKNFWHQIWLDTCSDREKIFCRGNLPPQPQVKGKIFYTRFGLIHVQTGKKFFCWGTSLPPPVKGKFFDTRFGLIHVQTGKKNFCQGTPPPPSSGKNFWHQIWLDTCSQGIPPPPCNSKKLLWLRGGRYASCVHAGGLSCLLGFHEFIQGNW